VKPAVKYRLTDNVSSSNGGSTTAISRHGMSEVSRISDTSSSLMSLVLAQDSHASVLYRFFSLFLLLDDHCMANKGVNADEKFIDHLSGPARAMAPVCVCVCVCVCVRVCVCMFRQ